VSPAGRRDAASYCRLAPDSGLLARRPFTAAMCHVWTAPCCQGFYERWRTAGRSCHVFGLSLRRCCMAAGHNALRRSGPGQKHALVRRCGTCGLSRSVGRLAWVRYSIIALSNLVSGNGFPRILRRSYAGRSRDASNFSPRTIMAQAMRAILLARAMAAIMVVRRSSSATSQGCRV